MGSTCTINNLPGNPLAGIRGGVSVTVDGDKVALEANDWAHRTNINLDAAASSYTTQDHWYAVPYGAPRTVQGGQLEARKMANRLDECRLSLPGSDATTAALLARISNRLR